ncbi:MAG: pilus assembly protein TadG-related protein [Mycobacteriales bacterium]|nr:pilus assembly protein TadG-related protein [Mycobacteriales bacterium]
MTRGDRGSGTVLVLCLAMVLTGTTVVLAGLGAAAVARHRAASAADLAALAAADRVLDGETAACAAARRAGDAVGARVRACRLDGDRVTVVVEVRPAGALAGLGSAAATARAGPGERVGSPTRLVP